MCEVQINGKAVEMMIDTDAPVNLLDEKTFLTINSGNTTLKLAHTKIYFYRSKSLFLC